MNGTKPERPSMTARHFQLIADTIRTAHTTESAKRKTAEHFADALATTNEHFNRARFLRECGVPVSASPFDAAVDAADRHGRPNVGDVRDI